MSTVLDPTLEKTGTAPAGPASPAPAGAAAKPPVDRPRAVGKRSPDDWFTLLGSVVASLCLAWLLYFQVLPFSGKVGFVIVWYLLFVGFYVGATAIAHSRAIVVDRLASALVHGAAALVALAVGWTIVYTLLKGWPAYKHLNFFSQDMSATPSTAPLNSGGIKHAIVGTGIQLGLAVVVALPLGLMTAIYLTEVGGRLAIAVRTVIEAMTALPDLVAGLFIYTILIRQPIHLGNIAVCASLAISITMLPIIARSSEVVLRGVPSGLREASSALGAPQWRTVLRVVLPTARSGLGTALILGMARGVGETAPLIITSGASTYFNANPFHDPMNSLPLFIYNQMRNTGLDPNAISRAYGAASVLLVLILLLFVFVRLLASDRSGR